MLFLLTTKGPNLCSLWNLFFFYKCVVCLFSKVFRSNFICEHKWKLKLSLWATPRMSWNVNLSFYRWSLHDVPKTFTLLRHELKGGSSTFEELEEIFAILGLISESRLRACILVLCSPSGCDLFGWQWKLHSYLGWLQYSTWSTYVSFTVLNTVSSKQCPDDTKLLNWYWKICSKFYTPFLNIVYYTLQLHLNHESSTPEVLWK